MTHQLTLLVLTTLCLGASSIRCYKCLESSYQIGNTTFDVPGGVKCDENATFACAGNETACHTISLGYRVQILDGVSGEANATLKGCSNSTAQISDMCEAAQKEIEKDLVNATMSLSKFKCGVNICSGRDLCNAGVLPGASLFLAALCLLVGQLF